jgi:hypothetical protein
MRNKVLSSHNFCLSTFKKLLTKIYVYKKDACYTHLYNDINNLIASGIFLRKYRDDLTENELKLAESSNAELNKIIDFRNHEERVDYLNTEMSIFVDPELNVAEKYLHVLIKAKQYAEQQLVNERDRKAQNAGRYLKSKKINNQYNKGRHSRKNKIYYGGSKRYIVTIHLNLSYVDEKSDQDVRLYPTQLSHEYRELLETHLKDLVPTEFNVEGKLTYKYKFIYNNKDPYFITFIIEITYAGDDIYDEVQEQFSNMFEGEYPFTSQDDKTYFINTNFDVDTDIEKKI